MLLVAFSMQTSRHLSASEIANNDIPVFQNSPSRPSALHCEMRPNNLSLSDKVQVLNDLESHMRVDEVVKKWKISQGTVYNIKKNSEKVS